MEVKKLLKNAKVQLFLTSLFALYLELIVIRWLSSEIRIFAFLKNIPLIVAFLGLGLGTMTDAVGSKIKERLPYFIIILVTVLSLSPHIGLSNLPIPSSEDVWIWWSSEKFLSPLWQMSTTITFAAIVLYIFTVSFFLILSFLLFFSVGQVLREKLVKFKPLEAYSYDLLGSMSGVVLFTALSYFSASPFWWFVIGFFILYLIIPINKRLVFLVLLSLLIIKVGTYNTFWSPYYRVEISQFDNKKELREIGSISLNVNHAYFQQMANLSENYLNSNPNSPLRLMAHDYNLPYEFINNPGEVLVVGAGTGNDVAAALRNKATKVDAVDIDPTIIKLGYLYHPESPYRDSKVNLIVDDARSYFEKSQIKYDTIVYGLLDSHTSSSTFSNIRLDNFVYTKESFEAARDHLKKDGNLVLSFAAGKPWILERISKMLENTFGQEPLVFKRREGTEGAIFVLGNNLNTSTLEKPEVKKLKIDLSTGDKEILIPTDNWPYLYLRHARIPVLYLATLLLVAVVFLLTSLRVLGKKNFLNLISLKGDAKHFFFLGSAFLLIEVKSINELSLLFGSTWVVNSSVILGILAMAFISNSIIKKGVKIPLPLIIFGLFGSLLLSYIFRVSSFSGTDILTKFVLGGFVVGLPFLFSGLLFSRSFEKTKNIAGAFGANLFGAFLGGIFENVGMITGIRELVFFAMFFYLIAISYLAKDNGNSSK